MKKLFALLLCAVMLVGMLPATALASTTIKEVTLTDHYGDLELGIWLYESDLNNGTEVPDMAAYHVESARFEKMGEPEEWYGVNETCCNAGDVVRKVFTIAANDGFTFADAEEVSVKVNGVEADIINAGEHGIEVEVRYAICNGFEPIHGVVPVYATLPELAVGDTMDAVVVTVDDGVNYAVSEVKWVDEEGNDVTGTVAEDGKIYCLMITVKANDGYFFTGWDGIMLGEESVETSVPGDEFGNSLSLDGHIYFSFAEEITSVAVTCADVEVGKVFPAATVADDANYVVSNQYWRNVTDDEPVEEGDVAEDGKVYDLVINLQPKDGYAFAEECTATLNGEEASCNRNSYTNLDVFLNVAFCDDIARADLTVGDVAFGEPAPTPVAPAGANYSVLDYVWIDCETEEEASVLEQGHKYNLVVHVRPADGYRFVEGTAFYIDGERADSYDVGNMIFEVVRYYSFCQRIDKVELTIPEAVLGAAPCAPDAVVLPSDALYTIAESTGWVDENGDPITVFADKQRYTFAVLLEADPFCEFDGGTDVYVNGKLMSESDVEIFSDQVIVWYRASFKDRITEVALPAWPELKVGDALPGIVPVVSADGKYEYFFQWNYLYGGDATVAEEDSVVVGLLCAVPVDGADEFADDVQVTLGGVAATPLFYDYSYDVLVLAKIYSFSDEVKLIDKIEITAELPEAGEGLGEISVPEDALYTLETEWGYTETAEEGLDDIQGLMEGDSFEAGQYAWIVPIVYAKEGCLIDPDAEIYVNGKKFVPEKDNVMFDDNELLYVAFAHRLGKVAGKTAVEGVNRLAGRNRFETAFMSADALKEVLGVEKFPAAIVTSGMNFADALAGSYLAAVTGAPILLTDNDNMADVIAYIEENVAAGGTIYALGGSAVVADTLKAVENSGYQFKRLAGANRFETNLMILEEAGVGEDTTILVCTAYNFADSLSASALGLPILLVDDTVSAAQMEYLSGLVNPDFCLVGGTGAVKPAVENQLTAEGYGVMRLAGANRFDTSVQLADNAFGHSGVDYAVLAYGYNFPDGLCAGPLAYALGAPLILTATGDEAAAVEYATAAGITSGFVLGGPTLIDDTVADSIFSATN